MPTIDLLRPTVLNGVIERFRPPATHTLLNRVRKNQSPYPFAVWDVVAGSQAIAKPNTPNSEAHIVPQGSRTQLSYAFIYLREKKVFSPTTLRWMREPGKYGLQNAEAAVLREFQDLNNRFDNFAELVLWRMLTGRLTMRYDDVVADIDYKLPDSHKVSLTTTWDAATPNQIVQDIRGLKRIVEKDGQVQANEVLTTDKTVDRIFDSFANSAEGAVLLSDRMKDQYYQTGKVEGFMGLTWNITRAVYDATGASYGTEYTGSDGTQFLHDDALILGNFTDNNPIELAIGPSADLEAPAVVGNGGKFAKTWYDKDPSGLQYLLEWSILPVATRPEQWVYVDNVGPDTIDPNGRLLSGRSWSGRSWA